MAHGPPHVSAHEHLLYGLVQHCEKQLLILQASLQGARNKLMEDLHSFHGGRTDQDVGLTSLSAEPWDGSSRDEKGCVHNERQRTRRRNRRGHSPTRYAGPGRDPPEKRRRDSLGGNRRFLFKPPFAYIRIPEVPDIGQPFSGLQTTTKPLVDNLKQSMLTLLRPFEPAGLVEPEVKLSQWEPLQGDTIAVLVKIPPPRSLFDHVQIAARSKIPALGPLVKVTFNKRDVPTFPREVDGSWRALIPTTPLDKPGTRDLQVLIRDGRHSAYERVIYLKNRDYIIESIQLPDRKKSLIGGATDKEIAAMSSLRALLSPQQLWRGPFLRPSKGSVTTYYGVQRYYNGRFAEGYYHRGVDYGAETGSPVHSPADARVVLVGHEDDGFRLHGNCLGLDHGQGVVSTMLHLDSIHVKEGEIVKTGHVLGTVGETGIATGPHLHWGLYVNGECIDPEPWMKEQFWL